MSGTEAKQLIRCLEESREVALDFMGIVLDVQGRWRCAAD